MKLKKSKMKKYKLRDLEEAAWLVYKKDLSQVEVSKLLGFSRPTISRILKEAKETGIVEIKVNISNKKNFTLKNDLMRRFHLKDAVIAPSIGNEEDIKELIAQKASDYLVKLLKKDDTIGISWGTTLLKVVNQMPNRNLGGRLIPLTGGTGKVANEFHSNNLAQQLAKKLSARSYALYAPAIVDNENAKKIVEEVSSIRSVIALFKEVRVALVGIGALSNKSTVIRSEYYSDEDFIKFKKSGAVGDLCSYLFDCKGNILSSLANKVIGVDIKTLKKIPFVIGIAGGKDKVEAIFGALKGSLINVLITDENCGEKVLASLNGKQKDISDEYLNTEE